MLMVLHHWLQHQKDTRHKYCNSAVRVEEYISYPSCPLDHQTCGIFLTYWKDWMLKLICMVQCKICKLKKPQKDANTTKSMRAPMNKRRSKEYAENKNSSANSDEAFGDSDWYGRMPPQAHFKGQEQSSTLVSLPGLVFVNLTCQKVGSYFFNIILYVHVLNSFLGSKPECAFYIGYSFG